MNFKQDQGTAYVDAIIFILISILVLSIFIGVAPVFIQYQKLSYVTRETIKEAEICGFTNAEVTDYYDDLVEEVGLTIKDVSWSGTEYIDGTKEVQINDKIVLTVTTDFSFFSGWIGDGISVELKSVRTGRSGVFYK